MTKKREQRAPSNTAVIYARYSSVNQRDESIDAQERACREYAVRNGFDVVSVYADSAKSGTNSDREQFQKMIADSTQQIFSHVIVHKLDRFSRDKYDSVHAERQLKMNGVRILSVIENLNDSPESQMLKSCLEGMAAYFSANLSREVMKGMRESALKCTHLGGIPPLGYDVNPETKKYIINEKEAVIVRAIFTKYADGVGYNQILEYLNGMGYRSKRGGAFGKNSLNSILTNEKYTGDFIFNKRLEKSVSGKRNPTLKPQEEWIVVPDGIPAIIDKETFNTVRAKMEENKRNSGQFKAKEIYLLSGLIKCGECKSSMTGNTRKSGRNKSNYSSYRCSNRANHRGCKNKEIRRDYIDNYVLDEIYRNLLSDISIKKLSEMLSEYNRKKRTETNTDLTQAQSELAEISQKIARVVRLVSESGVSIETVKDELRELEKSKQFVEGYIQDISVKNDIPLISEGMIHELIGKSRDFVKTHNIPECRKFIRSYIQEVMVFYDRVEIVFKIHVPKDEAIVPLKSENSICDIRDKYMEGCNAA